MNTFDPRLDILPDAQQALWPALRPVQGLGFVLYGGTAIAVQLGHRVSVDFDFFSDRPFVPDALRRQWPFLATAQTLESSPNTLTVSLIPAAHRDPVKLSFFGDIDFGHVAAPLQSRDGVLWAASLLDLMATKLKVLHDRVSAKDYIDLAALIEHGVSLAQGMAAARAMYGPAFEPAVTLKAMTWFKGGDLDVLTTWQKNVLLDAVDGFRGPLPELKTIGNRLLSESGKHS